mmetsp:Transcript_24357/g.67841  ORF Transcript_24357/g.67841 Transcript_24357/m.67841 type:complete len:205 (-) Transcript_24357:204-818(-)
MENESLPPMPKFRLGSAEKEGQTSDLLNRLQAFLPQIHAANEALDDGDEAARVDVGLGEQSDSDDNEDDDDDGDSAPSDSGDFLMKERRPNVDACNSAKADANDGAKDGPHNDSVAENEHATPTIQIQFALGDLSSNPAALALLKTDSNKDGSNDDDDDKSITDNTSVSQDAKTALVSNMLNQTKGASESGQGKSKKPLISIMD